MTRIYRYNFSETFANELYEFAKVHQYDECHTFKEEWDEWLAENEDIVQEETNRLEGIGYEGDIQDKMFKSARYYFRKKSTVKKAPAERRDYVTLDKGFLEMMDRHIVSHNDVKPAASFETFLQEYQDSVQRTVILLESCHKLEDSMQKIKKTYKNRYFTIKNGRYVPSHDDNALSES